MCVILAIDILYIKIRKKKTKYCEGMNTNKDNNKIVSNDKTVMKRIHT